MQAHHQYFLQGSALTSDIDTGRRADRSRSPILVAHPPERERHIIKAKRAPDPSATLYHGETRDGAAPITRLSKSSSAVNAWNGVGNPKVAFASSEISRQHEASNELHSQSRSVPIAPAAFASANPHPPHASSAAKPTSSRHRLTRKQGSAIRTEALDDLRMSVGSAASAPKRGKAGESSHDGPTPTTSPRKKKKTEPPEESEVPRHLRPKPYNEEEVREFMKRKRLEWKYGEPKEPEPEPHRHVPHKTYDVDKVQEYMQRKLVERERQRKQEQLEAEAKARKVAEMLQNLNSFRKQQGEALKRRFEFERDPQVWSSSPAVPQENQRISESSEPAPAPLSINHASNTEGTPHVPRLSEKDPELDLNQRISSSTRHSRPNSQRLEDEPELQALSSNPSPRRSLAESQTSQLVVAPPEVNPFSKLEGLVASARALQERLATQQQDFSDSQSLTSDMSYGSPHVEVNAGGHSRRTLLTPNRARNSATKRHDPRIALHSDSETDEVEARDPIPDDRHSLQQRSSPKRKSGKENKQTERRGTTPKDKPVDESPSVAHEEVQTEDVNRVQYSSRFSHHSTRSLPPSPPFTSSVRRETDAAGRVPLPPADINEQSLVGDKYNIMNVYEKRYAKTTIAAMPTRQQESQAVTRPPTSDTPASLNAIWDRHLPLETSETHPLLVTAEVASVRLGGDSGTGPPRAVSQEAVRDYEYEDDFNDLPSRNSAAMVPPNNASSSLPAEVQAPSGDGQAVVVSETSEHIDEVPQAVPEELVSFSQDDERPDHEAELVPGSPSELVDLDMSAHGTSEIQSFSEIPAAQNHPEPDELSPSERRSTLGSNTSQRSKSTSDGSSLPPSSLSSAYDSISESTTSQSEAGHTRRQRPQARQYGDTRRALLNPADRLSPQSISRKLMVEINLLEAIEESRIQLAELENAGQTAYDRHENRALDKELTDRQRHNEEELKKAQQERHIREASLGINTPTRAEDTPSAFAEDDYAGDAFDSISDLPNGARSHESVAEESPDETSPVLRVLESIDHLDMGTNGISEISDFPAAPIANSKVRHVPAGGDPFVYRIPPDASVLASMTARQIQAYLVAARTRRRDEEAHLMLRQRAVEDQVRCEVALLRHQRAAQTAGGGANPELLQLSRALEKAVMRRYATDKADIKRLQEAARAEYERTVELVKITIRTKRESHRREGSRGHSQRAGPGRTRTLSSKSGDDKDAESISEILQIGSGQRSSEVGEDIPSANKSSKSASRAGRRLTASAPTSPPREMPVSEVSEAYSDGETPQGSFAELLEQLRETHLKANNTSRLKRKEKKLEQSRQMAEELVRKNDETVNWEARLKAEEVQIRQLLDGVIKKPTPPVQPRGRAADPRTPIVPDFAALTRKAPVPIVNKRTPSVKSVSEIQEDIPVNEISESIAEEIPPDSGAMDDADGDVPEKIILTDDISSFHEQPRRRTESGLEKRQDSRASERAASDGNEGYAESFEDVSEMEQELRIADRGNQVFSKPVVVVDDLELVDEETREIERRVADLQRKLVERRLLAQKAHQNKKQQLLDVEARLKSELYALDKVIDGIAVETRLADTAKTHPVAASADTSSKPSHRAKRLSADDLSSLHAAPLVARSAPMQDAARKSSYLEDDISDFVKADDSQAKSDQQVSVHGGKYAGPTVVAKASTPEEDISEAIDEAPDSGPIISEERSPAKPDQGHSAEPSALAAAALAAGAIAGVAALASLPGDKGRHANDEDSYAADSFVAVSEAEIEQTLATKGTAVDDSESHISEMISDAGDSDLESERKEQNLSEVQGVGLVESGVAQPSEPRLESAHERDLSQHALPKMDITPTTVDAAVADDQRAAAEEAANERSENLLGDEDGISIDAGSVLQQGWDEREGGSTTSEPAMDAHKKTLAAVGGLAAVAAAGTVAALHNDATAQEEPKAAGVDKPTVSELENEYEDDFPISEEIVELEEDVESHLPRAEEMRDPASDTANGDLAGHDRTSGVAEADEPRALLEGPEANAVVDLMLEELILDAVTTMCAVSSRPATSDTNSILAAAIEDTETEPPAPRDEASLLGLHTIEPAHVHVHSVGTEAGGQKAQKVTDALTNTIMDSLIADTFERILPLVGDTNVRIPPVAQGRKPPERPVEIQRRPSSDLAAEFVNKLLAVHLPPPPLPQRAGSELYRSAPVLPATILQSTLITGSGSADELSPSRRMVLFHATNEALASAFAAGNHAVRVAQPLTREQLCKTVWTSVADWAGYSERHGENLDALLIGQIKKAEQVWMRRTEWEETAWEAVTERIWDDLLSDTVHVLDSFGT
ncbi:hypothetical protein HDU87_002350 [Geranomyces variabilis]|uniref:Uncharacterized protein n=1 Tax=Geranomyces variabilis TaxID=109894 RepID=A0AAD5TL74_9FUNG|nr:hypothetical protein HDU87_002350 [Geranomyces variabilis]